MASRNLFFTSIRYISRSCCRPKAKAEKLEIGNEIQVEVEKDTQKLATYVCGTNLFIEGEDVKIKPDSEYPDWLWSMRAPPPLEELDKNSKTYWNRIRRMREKEERYLKSLQKNKTLHK